jgi:hypothetical protein
MIPTLNAPGTLDDSGLECVAGCFEQPHHRRASKAMGQATRDRDGTEASDGRVGGERS